MLKSSKKMSGVNLVADRIVAAWHLFFRSGYKYCSHRQIHPPFTLNINGRTTEIFSDGSTGTIHGYADIYIHDCYSLRGFVKCHSPKKIVDIGANIGLFSVISRLYFPEASITAYEPNPGVFEWLKRNTKPMNVKIINSAVAEKTGTAMFNPEIDPTNGHLSLTGALKVECVGATELVKDQEIDLLKMDCEGGEWGILKNPGFLEKVAYAIIEYHLDGTRDLEQLIEMIQKGNHRVDKIFKNTATAGVIYTSRLDKVDFFRKENKGIISKTAF